MISVSRLDYIGLLATLFTCAPVSRRNLQHPGHPHISAILICRGSRVFDRPLMRKECLSDMERKSVAKDSLKLALAQLVTFGINMGNIMLLSRFRTVEEYGTYSQMIMVSIIIITFFSSGFSLCINYFLANESDPTNKSSFIKTYYAILLFCGIVGGILSVMLIPCFVRYFNNESIEQYWYFLYKC